MLNCKNIFIVLVYIYLMMYVVKKTMNKYLLTALVILLLFFQVEGFMSGFDGLVLKDVPKNVDLITSRKLAPLFSGYVPLNDHLANDQKDDMFLFKDNKCSPSCCPSTYSCNGGCVCTTKQQNLATQNRVGNNTSGVGPTPSEDITN